MPAVARPPPEPRPGPSSSVTLMASSLLLAQQVGTRWSRDTTAGRSLIGARWRAALSPVRVSWATGPRRTHAGPRRSSARGDGPVGTRGAPATTPAPALQPCRTSHQQTRGWTSERACARPAAGAGAPDSRLREAELAPYA